MIKGRMDKSVRSSYLRVVYMGTPDFAVPALKMLADSDHDVICVYTQPPRPAGRGQKLSKSAVHKAADDLGIPVKHPTSLKKEDAQKEFSTLNADIAVVAAYGLILPKAVLEAPKFGCINIHASLLPRWRGAAPIQRAILAGDTETGICIMQMDQGLDTGDILARQTVAITDKTTAQTLHDALAETGAKMTKETVDKIGNGKKPEAEAQTEDGMTYAKMLSREDGKIDWRASASHIERQIRALTPWPGVWCMADGQRLKIHAAEVAKGSGQPGMILNKDMTVGCGSGAIKLTSVQPEGKKPMDGLSFLNGSKLNVGDVLS